MEHVVIPKLATYESDLRADYFIKQRYVEFLTGLGLKHYSDYRLVNVNYYCKDTNKFLTKLDLLLKSNSKHLTENIEIVEKIKSQKLELSDSEKRTISLPYIPERSDSLLLELANISNSDSSFDKGCAVEDFFTQKGLKYFIDYEERTKDPKVLTYYLTPENKSILFEAKLRF